MKSGAFAEPADADLREVKSGAFANNEGRTFMSREIENLKFTAVLQEV